MEARNIAQSISTSGRKENFTQFFCVILLVMLLVLLLIIAIIILVAFKYAEAPQFHVKNIEVSAFRVIDLQPPHLSTNVNVYFGSDNDNTLVGVELWDVVMETTWFEIGMKLRGKEELQHFTQRSKSVSDLMMSAQGDFQLSNKTSLKKEDIKLDLTLKGKLNFYSGVMWTAKRHFMVLCDGVTFDSSNATCNTELFDGKSSLKQHISMGQVEFCKTTKKGELKLLFQRPNT